MEVTVTRKCSHDLTVIEGETKLGNIFSKSVVKKIAIGKGFSIALTESGQVFTWGVGTTGSLGHGNTDTISKPKRVNSLKKAKVIDVWVVDQKHSQVLTEENFVFVSSLESPGFKPLGTREEVYPSLPSQSSVHSSSASEQKQPETLPEGITLVEMKNDPNLVNAMEPEIKTTPQILEEKIQEIHPLDSHEGMALIMKSNCFYSHDGRFLIGDKIEDHIIVQLAVQYNVQPGVTFALCHDSSVFTWGGGSFGVLGNGSIHELQNPKYNDHLSAKGIVKIAGGGCMGAAVTMRGELWQWGQVLWNKRSDKKKDKEYDLKYPEMLLTPVLVNIDGAKFVDVVVQMHMFLAQTSDGRIYAMGNGKNSYQCSTLPTTSMINDLTLITPLKDVGPISCFDSSGLHSIFLSQSGSLYSCGYHAYFARGTDKAAKSALHIPTKIEAMQNVKIVSFCCSSHTSVFNILNSNGHCEVRICGIGRQLGLGSLSIGQVKPRPIHLFTGKHVFDVKSQIEYTQVLTDDGDLWVSGVLKGRTDAKFVPCGDSLPPVVEVMQNQKTWLDRQEDYYSHDFELGLGGLVGGKVVTMLSNNSTGGTLALAEGSVFSWGTNSYGCGGYPGNSRSSPYALDRFGTNPNQKRAVWVALGFQAGYVVTEDGQVWSFGHSTKCQIGIPENKLPKGDTIDSPIRVKGALEKEHVVSISSRYGHCLALTSEGRVFLWGLLRARGNEMKYWEPVLVDLPEPATMVSTGYNFSLVASETRVYSSGEGVYGGTGLPKNADATEKFMEITLPGKNPKSRILSVSGGMYHGGCVTEDGVFLWGCNASGQLGVQPQTHSTKTLPPTKVSQLSLCNGEPRSGLDTIISMNCSLNSKWGAPNGYTEVMTAGGNVLVSGILQGVVPTFRVVKRIDLPATISAASSLARGSINEMWNNHTPSRPIFEPRTSSKEEIKEDNDYTPAVVEVMDTIKKEEEKVTPLPAPPVDDTAYTSLHEDPNYQEAPILVSYLGDEDEIIVSTSSCVSELRAKLLASGIFQFPEGTCETDLILGLGPVEGNSTEFDVVRRPVSLPLVLVLNPATPVSTIPEDRPVVVQVVKQTGTRRLFD